MFLTFLQFWTLTVLSDVEQFRQREGHPRTVLRTGAETGPRSVTFRQECPKVAKKCNTRGAHLWERSAGCRACHSAHRCVPKAPGAMLPAHHPIFLRSSRTETGTEVETDCRILTALERPGVPRRTYPGYTRGSEPRKSARYISPACCCRVHASRPAGDARVHPGVVGRRVYTGMYSTQGST